MNLFTSETANSNQNKRIYAIQKGISNKNTEFDRLRRLAIKELKNE